MVMTILRYLSLSCEELDAMLNKTPAMSTDVSDCRTPPDLINKSLYEAKCLLSVSVCMKGLREILDCQTKEADFMKLH